jgi:chorismate-pyruvate lyase
MLDRLASIIQPSIDFSTLPPILRVLLLTDGTVTHSLAAYFAEDIQVRCLSQVQVGDEVIEREVMLVGELSGTEYAHAHSTIHAHLLDPEMRRRLDSGQAGIGELLNANNRETFREITQIRYCHDLPDRPNPFKALASAEEFTQVIARDYRIHTQQRPLILITEEFPVASYLGLGR